ncbi:MAG: hypothetical protein JSS35_03050 [Proteobacteria bacterium]|nr:hypothetical protein [Pseudomonadota bacterium]
MDRRVFVLAALALGGCATAGGPPGRVARVAGPLQELEPLYAASAGREALRLTVGSNGCTAKADFTFYAEKRGDAVGLAFARRHVDPCKSLVQGKAEIAFTWEELGVAPSASVFLLNPIAAWTGPAPL